jgi:hypothetical protein
MTAREEVKALREEVAKLKDDIAALTAAMLQPAVNTPYHYVPYSPYVPPCNPYPWPVVWHGGNTWEGPQQVGETSVASGLGNGIVQQSYLSRGF